MKKSIIVLLFAVFSFQNTNAQNIGFNPEAGCILDADGNCLPSTILSAVPFLRITPDARGGAMGDAGIAASADPNALHYNSSKLAFIEKDASFSATYTPWLRNLGLNDVFLTYLSGYKKVDDLQTIGFGLRFFSLGEINFTDNDGNPAGMGNPREFEFAVSYNRKLSENLAAGLTGKYIFSNLASGQRVGTTDINSANAFAADLSLTYRKEGDLAANGSELTLAAAITNFGSKITYTGIGPGDFLPTNLGLGARLKLNLDEYNSLSFLLDINKLLVPSPVSPTLVDDTGVSSENPEFDADRSGFPDFKEQSIFGAAISSFGDAPGGLGEEIKEYTFSLGMEYWYSGQFAVRAGYYYENPLKGDRQFITVGAGLKYNVFQMDLSYLVPTNNRRNPLDNTLRFTLQFDFAALTADQS